MVFLSDGVFISLLAKMTECAFVHHFIVGGVLLGGLSKSTLLMGSWVIKICPTAAGPLLRSGQEWSVRESSASKWGNPIRYPKIEIYH